MPELSFEEKIIQVAERTRNACYCGRGIISFPETTGQNTALEIVLIYERLQEAFRNENAVRLAAMSPDAFGNMILYFEFLPLPGSCPAAPNPTGKERKTTSEGTADYYKNLEKTLAQSKNEMLANFNRQLELFIANRLSAGQLDGRGPVRIKCQLLAPMAVVDYLGMGPTVEEIRGLPNCQRMAQICEGADCMLAIDPQPTPLKNEGLVYYNFYLYIDRD